MTWTVKAQGDPGTVASDLGLEIRGNHGTAPDSWEASLHHVMAASASHAAMLIGRSLVARNLDTRLDARTEILRQWRRRVEAERAIYDSLPLRDQKGFVAEPEPDLGPVPQALPITAEVTGNTDIDGDVSYSVTVRLVED